VIETLELGADDRNNAKRTASQDLERSLIDQPYILGHDQFSEPVLRGEASTDPGSRECLLLLLCFGKTKLDPK
jgi:hypothetical protein